MDEHRANRENLADSRSGIRDATTRLVAASRRRQELVMKKIEALIHPAQWDDLRPVLESLAVPVTLREVKTFGRTPLRREVYRGTAYYVNVTPALELSAIVEEHQLEATLAVLESQALGCEVLVFSVEGYVHRAAIAPKALAPRGAPARAIPALRVAVPRHA
jgi:nitrogen regulatory protein PII